MEPEEVTYDEGDTMAEEDSEVFAMNDDAKVEYSLEACPKLLLKGQCWNRDCKFSHKSALINSEKGRLMQQWSKQVDQKKPSAHDQTLMVDRKQQQRHEAPTGG